MRIIPFLTGFSAQSWHEPGDVEEALNQSLKSLGLEYGLDLMMNHREATNNDVVDLYLMHCMWRKVMIDKL